MPSSHFHHCFDAVQHQIQDHLRDLDTISENG